MFRKIVFAYDGSLAADRAFHAVLGTHKGCPYRYIAVHPCGGVL